MKLSPGVDRSLNELINAFVYLIPGTMYVPLRIVMSDSEHQSGNNS